MRQGMKIECRKSKLVISIKTAITALSNRIANGKLTTIIHLFQITQANVCLKIKLFNIHSRTCLHAKTIFRYAK